MAIIAHEPEWAVHAGHVQAWVRKHSVFTVSPLCLHCDVLLDTKCQPPMWPPNLETTSRKCIPEKGQGTRDRGQTNVVHPEPFCTCSLVSLRIRWQCSGGVSFCSLCEPMGCPVRARLLRGAVQLLFLKTVPLMVSLPHGTHIHTHTYTWSVQEEPGVVSPPSRPAANRMWKLNVSVSALGLTLIS